MRKADNLKHNPVPLSRNLGTLTSWNPLGHFRPVTGLFTFTFLSVKTLSGLDFHRAPKCFSFHFGVHLVLTPVRISLHPFKPEVEGEIANCKNIILGKNMLLFRQLCSS